MSTTERAHAAYEEARVVFTDARAAKTTTEETKAAIRWP